MRSTHRDTRSGSAPGETQARRSRGVLALVPALVPVLVLALVASGCGGGGSSSSRSTKTAAPVAVQAHSTPRPVTAAPPLRLSILAPRGGAHTSSTLTVRVALAGAGGSQRFKYVLDHRLTRLGSARLTFHDLAPGHHRLDVFLATSAASRAAVAFTVRAPAPVAVPTPTQTTSATTSSAPAPPPPPTTTAESPPSPPPTTAPSPRPSGGIPQGGGGDGDGDNSGGPSDGDGNI